MGPAVHHGKEKPVRLCKPRVMRVRGPTILEELCRSIHCCATFRRSQNNRNLGRCDRFQTLCNNSQQGVQTDAACNIQQCWKLFTNNVASVCTRLYSFKTRPSATNTFFTQLFQALCSHFGFMETSRSTSKAARSEKTVVFAGFELFIFQR